MSANQSRLLGLVLLAAFVGLVMHLIRDGEADRLGRDESSNVAASSTSNEPDYTIARARLANGAYVAKTRQLTDHESLVEIVIPEGYSQELDTRCLVYKDTDPPSSTMTCNGPLFRRAP